MPEVGAKIAFVHIPRTAGTAFGRFLEQRCPGVRTFDFYAGATGSASPVIEAFRRKTTADKQSYGLLKGHFVFGFDAELEGFSYLVFLRRPLERLISYYFYALADPENYLHRLLIQRRMRLEEFLLSDVSIELDNFQVRAISGIGGDVGRGEVTTVHLELAKRNLVERFSAFGITERYEESIRKIEMALGWHTTGAVNGGVPAKQRATPLSNECRQEVTARNYYDVELYNFADRLFSGSSAPT